MFEGEKTFIFWIGLIILGLASVVLSGILWEFAVTVWHGFVGTSYARPKVPFLVGGVVFTLIGLYMMKSGVKKP